MFDYYLKNLRKYPTVLNPNRGDSCAEPPICKSGNGSFLPRTCRRLDQESRSNATDWAELLGKRGRRATRLCEMVFFRARAPRSLRPILLRRPFYSCPRAPLSRRPAPQPPSDCRSVPEG